VYAFSPQEAAAGVGEHAEGCAACAAEVEDLRMVLAGLAQLPEPELPVEVGVRLDAAIARAWQEADAEQAAAAAAASARRRFSWRRFAVPVGALCLLAVGGVGAGLALNHGSQGSPSAASGAAAENSGDVALNQWVHSVLPGDSYGTGAQSPGGATPQVQNGSKAPHVTQGPLTQGPSASGGVSACPSYPQLAGYRVLTAAEREFEGKQATLVVYQNDEGPASATVYAVVYAGPCPNASSEVLDQGVVSR
jgi:hypothetical protein